MKAKLSFLGAMLAIASTASMSAETSYVTVNLNNGSRYSYLLSSAPKISYSNDSMLISGSANTGFLLSDVGTYNFTEGNLTDTPVIESNDFRISYTDNSNVKAEGLQPNSSVALYSIAGAFIKQANASEDGVAEIGLPQAKGVYILKTNSQTVKLIKE